MTAFLARKRLGALHPVDERGQELLRGIGQNEVVRVEVKRARHVRRFRLYWSIVSLAWEALDDRARAGFPTVESFSDGLKIMAGHRETMQLPDGTIFFRPKSISFARCSEAEFQAYLDAVVKVLLTHWLPGVTRRDLRERVLDMIGEREAA